jgi:ribA/ribD-fused uncharacterized protein
MAFGDSGFGANRTGMARSAARARAPQQGQVAQNSWTGGEKLSVKPLQDIGGRWTEAQLIAMIPELLAARHIDAAGVDAYAGIGSRETPQDVLDEMTAIAVELERGGFRMRSGGAGGADTAFDNGVLDRANKDVILPWKNFSGIQDGVMLPKHLEARAEQMALKYHPAPDRLFDADGKAKPALKLHTRNMPQVLGLDLETPAKMVIAYTPDGAASGGTGQAIRVAEDFGVPVLNLRRPEIRAAVLEALGLTPERILENVRQSKLARGVGVDVAAVPASDRAFDFSRIADRQERVWDRETSAVFFKGSDEYGPQTNMSPRFPYKDGELSWKSSEHQYQASRFEGRPDLQAAIYDAPDAFVAKRIARENMEHTRPDWKEMNVPMMAYVVTKRRDAHPQIQQLLDRAHSKGLTLVEQSSRDPFWGAVERNGQLRGRNMLGGVLDQAASGARLDELPKGTTFPTLAEIEQLRQVRIEAESRGQAAPAVHRAASPVVADPASSGSKGSVGYRPGVDVSRFPADVIVNTVNANLSKASMDGSRQDGNPVMGAGVAKAFKERYGDAILRPYAQAIRKGELKAGGVQMLTMPDGQVVANLATKQDWRADSRMEWIESGLIKLADEMRKGGHTSVALPPPGCGNGGMDWKDVEPLVLKHLAGFDVIITAAPSNSMLTGRDGSETRGVENRSHVLQARRDEAAHQKPQRGFTGSTGLGVPNKPAAERVERPKLNGQMYFPYGRGRREGVEANTTFEAILSGERTSTTRFDNWPSSANWGRLKEGDLVRMFEDKTMDGRYVDVRVKGVERIDLAEASQARIEDWSKSEGWSVEAGREYGRKNQPGWQVRYEPVPGQEILKQRERGDDDLPLLAAAAAMRDSRGR